VKVFSILDGWDPGFNILAGLKNVNLHPDIGQCGLSLSVERNQLRIIQPSFSFNAAGFGWISDEEAWSESKSKSTILVARDFHRNARIHAYKASRPFETPQRTTNRGDRLQPGKDRESWRIY